MNHERRISIKKGHAIAFDFDGVIHKYSKGWMDGSIYDGVNHEMIGLMRVMMCAGVPCFILSTRKPKQILAWWQKNVNIPAALPEGMKSGDYMRICFAMIDTADAVAFLPDYAESRGAMVEHGYSQYIGKQIFYL